MGEHYGIFDPRREHTCKCGKKYTNQGAELMLKPAPTAPDVLEAHCPCGVLLLRRMA